MPNTLYKITMDGSLAPGVTLDFAQDNLARLFKADVAAIKHLFSGKPTVIKRDISAAQADKYITALFNAGIIANKETDFVANLSLEPTEAEETASSTHSMTCPNSMTCPKCAVQQAENPICQSCGIVIAKFNSHQAQAAHPAQAVQSTPYASPQAIIEQNPEDVGELNIWGIEGRLGRMRYIAWSIVFMLALIPAVIVSAVAFKISAFVGIPVALVVTLAAIVIGIQISVKRLHDIGWSGWLILITVIPVVGSIFQLLMFFLPGSTGSNRYGAPPPANSTAVIVLFWIWVVLVAVGFVLGIIGGMLGAALNSY